MLEDLTDADDKKTFYPIVGFVNAIRLLLVSGDVSHFFPKGNRQLVIEVHGPKSEVTETAIKMGFSQA